MTIFELIAEATFCMVTIWIVLKVWEKYLIVKNIILQEQVNEIVEQIKNNIIRVDIEKHDGVFYLYEKDTREFIAQGSNFEEVRERCESRFKGKSIVGDEAQMSQLGLK